MVAVAADTYAPFDTGAGANVTEGTWRKMMRHMTLGRDGVLKGINNNLEPYADSTGMQIKVRTGECWIKGHWAEFTSEKTVTVTAAHPTLSRIDRIILRADFNDSLIEVDVLAGTAASSPSAPAVTQDSSVWEVSLGTISIPAADTSIGSNQVTDNRFYANASYARYYANGTQSLPNSSMTEIDFHDAETTTGDVLKIDADTFELQRTGWWHIDTSIRFDAPGSGYRQVVIGQSGALDTVRYAEVKYPGDTSNHSGAAFGTSKYLTSGTRVCVGAFQNRGSAMNISDEFDGTYIAMTWLGP